MPVTAWTDVLDEWRCELRAGGRAAGTIRLRTYWLSRFAREMTARRRGPWDVQRSDIIRSLARGDWSPETRKSFTCSVRAFYAWAVENGHVQSDPAAKLPRVHVPRPEPRPAPDDVIETAIHEAGDRERLMLMLAAFCGLRRAEVASVHTQNLVGSHLRVHGKGGKTRTVPVPLGLVRVIRAAPPGWLFPSPCGGHLSADHVGKLMRAALPGRWTPHTLRHAAATAWADAGLDLHELARLLGHANLTTTAIYVAVRSKRIDRAVDDAARRFGAAS